MLSSSGTCWEGPRPHLQHKHWPFKRCPPQRHSSVYMRHLWLAWLKNSSSPWPLPSLKLISIQSPCKRAEPPQHNYLLGALKSATHSCTIQGTISHIFAWHFDSLREHFLFLQLHPFLLIFTVLTENRGCLLVLKLSYHRLLCSANATISHWEAGGGEKGTVKVLQIGWS